MAMNGADVLIYIEGNLVGSQRGVTFKESNEEIDYSSKDSRAFQGGPGWNMVGKTQGCDGNGTRSTMRGRSSTSMASQRSR